MLDGLNESQTKAVTTTEGPLLVVAGPGTGKTLTIVRRIAHLVRQGVRPEDILAVTFTNRAAREMKERTGALLGDAASNIFIGTFHLLGLRIIRAVRSANFVICGRDEQVEILKSVMKGPAKKAQLMAERISRRKNIPGDLDDEIKEIFDAYQAALMHRNAFDFDDLILVPIAMLESGEAAPYRDRFKHVIVDEYQDINPAQYRLLRLLSGSTNTVCAVGDPDQAIYAFRGADVGNFMKFEKDFPGATRITLSHNYRSSGIILNAADSVIRNNRQRIAKELVPARGTGARITVVSAPDGRAEGAAIIREIEERMGGTSRYRHYRGAPVREDDGRSYRFSDFAVIYRTNAQARALEEAFAASGIPCQTVGRRSGVQSKEIEKTLAFLRSLIRADGTVETTTADTADAMEAKLLTPADFFDPRADAVALMTLHMAKGLEFDVVFVTGCEDGLIPCSIMKDGVDIEEERRLFYVGMTRAKDELFLLRARSRFLFGQRLVPPPSPFVGEIPEEYRESRAVADKIKKQRPEENQMGLF